VAPVISALSQSRHDRNRLGALSPTSVKHVPKWTCPVCLACLRSIEASAHDYLPHGGALQKLKDWGLCLVGHGRRACVNGGGAGFRPVS
jgi:hypothetical protein